MKKILLFFILIFLFLNHCQSQDLLILRSHKQISSKILEVGQTEIKYKKYANQNGPVYVVLKSEVAGIIYENGTKDIFDAEQAKPGNAVTDPMKGNADTVKKAEPSASGNGSGDILIGFSGVLPTGTWPATALTNMGTSSFLKGQGNTVKSYGFGVIIQAGISNHFNLFFDMNAYDYNIFLAKQGADVQTVWTIEESATHWDESGAPQIQYVHNLPTDVHFDMQATGMRLGAKYVIGNSRIRPWVGIAFGFYKWTANYYNADKSKTYGKDEGSATGLTFLMGVDLKAMAGIVITPFIDLASPVAKYKMEGLFYPQWDIEYNAHIMGTNRVGLSICFSPVSNSKK